MRVSDRDRSVCFPLDETSGQKVRDRNGKVYGRVTNPAWLSNDASHWKKVSTLVSDIPGGHYYDPVRHEAGLFTAQGVKKYNLNTDRTSESAYATPCPVHLLLGTSFLKGDGLFAYELSDWVEGPGKTSEEARRTTEDRRKFLMDEAFIYRFRDMTLSSLAALLNLSERQTLRNVREYYGMSFVEFRAKSRLNAAAKILREKPDLSVTDAAELVGFSSAAHFRKLFQKEYGMSPSEWRSRQKKE